MASQTVVTEGIREQDRPNYNPAGIAGTGAASASAAGNQVASANLPGYMTSMANIGTNILSQTRGEVPEDVINLLKQQGAEQNVTTGAGSNAAYLRALGLTSLGLKDQGQKNLESILNVTPGFGVSQGREFQTSAALNYEGGLQQQVFQRQAEQQRLEFEEQMAALNAARSGVAAGGGGTSYDWGLPTNAWAAGNPLAFGGGGGAWTSPSGATTTREDNYY